MYSFTTSEVDTPMEAIAPRAETISFPDRYTNIKQLTSDHLTHRENKGRNSDLEARYAERFSGKDGNTKVEVQLRDTESESKPDVLKFGDGEQTKEVKVVARVWLTEKTGEEGKGHAVCYKLGEDGKWYKQTADSYKYNKEKNTNYWALKSVKQVDDNEEQIELNSRIAKLQAPQKKVA